MKQAEKDLKLVEQAGAEPSDSDLKTAEQEAGGAKG